MNGEIIDPRIVPGVLIRLNQRVKYVPFAIRDRPGFEIQNQLVPVWAPTGQHYEHVLSGSIATVIKRYEESAVTKLTVLVNERLYHCYGVHADLLE